MSGSKLPDKQRAMIGAALGVGLCVAVGVADPGGGSPDARAPDSDTAAFTVAVGGERNPYRVLGLFVMPGERVTFSVVDEDRARRGRRFVFTADGAPIRDADTQRATWRAPNVPGLHAVRIVQTGAAPGDTMRFNVFVQRPFSDVRDGYLGEYRIGRYPEHPLRGLSSYRRPEGFVEVTEAMVGVPVSPHYTLGQFLCKQASGFPKYLVLKERLLLKLELLLAHVNRAGIACERFVIMSGYRTPHYNAAIGNVRYSRHLWGGAADIYIDERPRDGIMDDLDGDGSCTEKDALVLKRIVESISGRPFYAPFVGGLAGYRATAAHGPFVHVDVRGERARWGL